MKYFKLLSIIIFTVLNSSCSEANSGKNRSSEANNSNTNLNTRDFIQQKISEGLYVLKNPDYNTNVGVVLGEKSILLIDPMTGFNNQQQLLTAIQQLSNKPIKYVVNTHHHLDHSGANTFFKGLGANIIAHENAKFSNAISDITFTDTYTVNMGNEIVELHHSISHTFDDVLVHLKNSNTLFMGDTYMTNSFPHFYYGGGGSGHLANLDKALLLGNSETTIVAAHGRLVSNKKDLTTYRENSVKWINRIQQLHKEDKTAEYIASDGQIQQLSIIFNSGNEVSNQRLVQTINKIISVDLPSTISLSEEVLKKYQGFYQYNDGQTDEIIYQNEKLILRSVGNYIYEIVPVSETKFHIKGQFPNKHLSFDSGNRQFVFFNGKENLVAKSK